MSEKLLDLKFKMAITNMPRLLIGKVDNTQEQIGNVSIHGDPKKIRSKC